MKLVPVNSSVLNLALAVDRTHTKDAESTVHGEKQPEASS